MKFRTGLVGLAAVLAIYVALNFFVLKRPVTLEYIQAAYAHKSRYASDLLEKKQPKILLVAGSNGLYSHSCATLEAVVGRPCVNFAVSYIAGLETVLAKPRPFVAQGDIVLMPLEYGFYSETEGEIANGVDGNRYVALYDRGLLAEAGWRRQMSIIFSLGVREIFTSVGEMTLSRAGLRRETDKYQMDIQGDLVGHTRALGSGNQPFLLTQKAATLDGSLVTRPPSAGTLLIKNAVASYSRMGAKVFGSLPVTFDERYLSAEQLAWMRELYASSGGDLLLLGSQSRYPRTEFYNTQYHLNEEAQRAHSSALGRELCKQMSELSCSSAGVPPLASGGVP